MLKRNLSIILTICMFFSIFAGCKSTKDIQKYSSQSSFSKNYDESSDLQSGQVIIEDETVGGESNQTSGNKKGSASNSGKGKNNSKSRGSTTTNVTPSNGTLGGSDAQPRVIHTSNDIFKEQDATYSESFLYPSTAKTDFSHSSSNVYENEYAKIDARNAKKGYVIVTSKVKGTKDLTVTIESKNNYGGAFYPLQVIKYKEGEFFTNKEFVVNLGKNDATYYIGVNTTLCGVESIKLYAEIGSIVFDGQLTYSQVIPNADQIKMREVSKGVYQNDYAKININTASEGYVEVTSLMKEAEDITVSLVSSKKNEQGKNAAFGYGSLIKEYKNANFNGICTLKVPLTYGNGKYNISMMSYLNSGSTGFMCKKAEVEVNISNVSDTKAFLMSTDEVYFNSNMQFIKKAKELCVGAKDNFEKVIRINEWLISYMSYKETDYTAQGLYICDLERKYKQKTGVCYDYAIIFAAMLRSQGIPCKAVFGYLYDVGHVWNQVYVPGNGKIQNDSVTALEGNKWCYVEPQLKIVKKGVLIDPDEWSKYKWRAFY